MMKRDDDRRPSVSRVFAAITTIAEPTAFSGGAQRRPLQRSVRRGAADRVARHEDVIEGSDDDHGAIAQEERWS